MTTHTPNWEMKITRWLGPLVITWCIFESGYWFGQAQRITMFTPRTALILAAVAAVLGGGLAFLRRKIVLLQIEILVLETRRDTLERYVRSNG